MLSLDLIESSRTDLERSRAAQKELDLQAKYVDSYRLLCRGIVISQTSKFLGRDFALRGLEQFWEHLRKAINKPETFEFDGRYTAAQYIQYHEERLGMPITDDFRIVEPGEVYPLAPNKRNIV